MNTVRIDTEFRDSRQPFVVPVCAVIQVANTDIKYWFPEDKEKFIVDWRKCMDKKLAIVCYFASAETRFFLALGFPVKEILSWTWLDCYILWRMLTHSNPAYKYGWKILVKKDGSREWVQTTPPILKSEWLEDDEGLPVPPKSDDHHSPVGLGLYDAIAARFKIDLNTQHKDMMRQLIMIQDEYSEQEKTAILDYCTGDVQYLKNLFTNLYKEVHKLSYGECDIPQIIRLSRYVVCCGIMENNGIPIDKEKADNLGKNFFAVIEAVTLACNDHYPFFIRRKTKPSEKVSGWGELTWVESYKTFAEYLSQAGYVEHWPKTPTGKFKKDGDTLYEYAADPVIHSLYTTKTSRKQLSYFRPIGYQNIQANMGDDDRIRVILSPYGTKTGRNSPSVKKGFILAMSTWFRPLLSVKDRLIIYADFSAQEIALQGWVSGDTQFLNAYKSKDPYTWFAQQTNSLPGDVYRQKGKFYNLEGTPVAEEDQQRFQAIRNSFKTLVLGVGFGMGLDKLSVRLTASRIESLSEDEKTIIHNAVISKDEKVKEQAWEIIERVRVVAGNTDPQQITYPRSAWALTYRNFHKSTFAQYWKWRDLIIRRYRTYGYLKIDDGWCLFEGEAYDNSIANFPVQGHGSVLLRRAIENCLLDGLEVVAPLHDAIYITCKPEDEKSAKERLEACMKKAVISVCGEDLIRIDTKTCVTNWDTYESTFTIDKGTEEFKKFGKYMFSNISGPSQPDSNPAEVTEAPVEESKESLESFLDRVNPGWSAPPLPKRPELEDVNTFFSGQG